MKKRLTFQSCDRAGLSVELKAVTSRAAKQRDTPLGEGD